MPGRRALLRGLVAVGLLSCAAAFGQERGPRAYLSAEHFRKQRECDARPAYRREKFGEIDDTESLHQAPRPALWSSQRVFLGDTCFLANIGPVYYTDRSRTEAAYYSIDVEVPVAEPGAARPKDRSWLVLFSRDLKVSELPPGFQKIEIGKAVSYNEAERTVRFEIGEHRYEYKLPAP